MIVKANIDGDIRRFPVTILEKATAAQTFQTLRATVARAFDLDVSQIPTMRYRDEEGDLCTLVEASVDDMLHFAKAGNLRLFASKVPTVEEESLRTVTDDVSEVAVTQEADAQPPPVEIPVYTVATGVSEAQQATSDESPEAADPGGDEQDDHLLKAPEVTNRQLPATRREEHGAAGLCAERAGGPAAVLLAMGFPEEEARAALESARGDVAGAVEHLINGEQRQRARVEDLESSFRAIPAHVLEQAHELQGQLRGLAAVVKGHQEHYQGRLRGGELEQLQASRAAIEDMRSRLGELWKFADAALKKASGAQPDGEQEEACQKIEAVISEAQQFVAETVATLQLQASSFLKGTVESEPDASNADALASDTAPDDSIQARIVALRQAIEAAIAAATDAAGGAMAAVDDMLLEEASKHSATSADSPVSTDDACQQDQEAGRATKLDRAQVFLSQSLSAIRCRASGFLAVQRPDHLVTVPSTARRSSSDADGTTDHVIATAEMAGDGEDANAVP